MKHLIHIVLLLVFTACTSSKQLSEHEVVCHISGEGFDVKNVRVCLVWSDMWNGDPYQEIRVKDGRFDAEVILDTNQVYELCVPHPEYGFATYRNCEFFYSKNGIRFGQRSAIDGERIVLINATEQNKTYYDYINERDSLYMGWYEKLMEAQDSLNNIGQMYDSHWLEMCDQQNDDSMPQSYRDSITIEVNKMSMSGEHRTPLRTRASRKSCPRTAPPPPSGRWQPAARWHSHSRSSRPFCTACAGPDRRPGPHGWAFCRHGPGILPPEPGRSRWRNSDRFCRPRYPVRRGYIGPGRRPAGHPPGGTGLQNPGSCWCYYLS